MTVYVVLREDQSQHGFVDTSVIGLFVTEKEAQAVLESKLAEAREQGLRVCGDPGTEDDPETESEWEVSGYIQRHPLR